MASGTSRSEFENCRFKRSRRHSRQADVGRSCFPCRPPDLTDEPDPDNPDIRFESAGDLYARLRSPGIASPTWASTGSASCVFSISRRGDMIGVHGLYIYNNFNEMHATEPGPGGSAFAGLSCYGGISLAKVGPARATKSSRTATVIFSRSAAFCAHRAGASTRRQSHHW